MNEEKTALYTRKHPASDGGFDDRVQAMENVAADAGYEVVPCGSYCEGDMQKQFETLTGAKLGDGIIQAIAIVQED